ncbi:MAG: ABC transporter permease, partial [Alphaproteobacteria bacterium]|nr:ABC transporter permease [Alphaproteobacteria bacterium]
MIAPLLGLARRSLVNRRVTAGLTVLTIGLSVALLLGVETVRNGARLSFANTISNTDLIVGARTGPIQLLLYSVFGIGNATNNIAFESYEEIADWPNVAWTVPISLGDSHRGYRVLGTTQDYFTHYRYGSKQAVAFAEGAPFADIHDAVIGAEVADTLGYRIDSEIVVAHGLGSIGGSDHDDEPFRVSGVLSRTGTPVDRTIYVALSAMEAIHDGWESGMPPRPGHDILTLRDDEHDEHDEHEGEAERDAITAILIGVESKLATFDVQRKINEYRAEPLLAILPGATLQELWDSMGTLESALLAISVMVVGTGLLGMMAVSLAALNERRREMAILRSVGARPAHIFGLLVLESGLLAAAGALAGLLLLYVGLGLFQPFIQANFGLRIPLDAPSLWQWTMLGLVVLAGCLSGIVPATRAYRNTLADGMIV